MNAQSETRRISTGDVNSMRWHRRLWRYLPLVLWLALIFIGSTNALSASNTSLIIEPLFKWLFPQITESELESVHFVVRKLGHFSEYAVLALLAARAFLSSTRTLLRRRWFAVSLCLVAAYALLDEYHQSFVPTRTASIKDSMIDIAGGATALLLLAWWRTYHLRPDRVR